jgi:sec-independent protein translocase protein TatC
MTSDNALPIMKLLLELRKRLIVVFIAVIMGMGVAWNLSADMLKFIEKPLTGQTYLTNLKKTVYDGLEKRYPGFYQHYGPVKETAAAIKDRQLNYSAPLEPFFVQCKISLIAGLILVLPVIFHQVWLLVAPGLKIRGKRLVIPFVMSATLAFCLGATFFLLVIWPVIINFSLSYESAGLQSWFNLSEYVNFCLRLILIFGLIFELPIGTLLLSRLGLINGKLLARNRKYALLVSAIISAFHADLLTMFVIMIPLYLMYEISVWTAYAFAKERQAESPALDDAAILGHPIL